ncbi:MAG: hypoxanthine phosphoribosyltransferase [Actinomycetota bacterium]|nr:hypoxanthine phosphoribosyltransferase [Actinomycetota bacterium]
MGDVYLSRRDLAARVRELGAEISADYAGRDLLVVALLRGAFVFASDLARAIAIPHAMDFVALAGYGPADGRPGVRLMKDLDDPVAGRDVLLVDNVVDTGLTLNYLLKTLALRDPATVAVCTLLDRPYRRLCDDLPIRYVGFTVPDEFFVGYGFELDGRYRCLPDLRVVLRR